ncbi:hypothetical protein NMG60_11017074 [Bertholletia excelsa]
MFYSHTFLARKGPLGTVWCAAHLQHRLKKSHYTSTNISSTVDRIMHPEVPIALRLSGHLLLGVVRIYSKKVDYLHQDCNDFLISIRKAFASVEVNLPEDATHAPFQSVTLPDTFDLDALNLEDKLICEGTRDNHLSSQEEITLTDQIPAREDPYITITFDELLISFVVYCSARPSSVDQTARVKDHVHQAQDSERPNEGSHPQDVPDFEFIRDAVSDFHADIPLSPNKGNDDVIEPDKILEQQIINEKILNSVAEEIPVSVEKSQQSQQHGEPPTSAVSNGGPDIIGSHISLGQQPEIQIRSTPIHMQKAKTRKRKLLYDESTVLTNRFMKAALNDYSDLRRKRKCCPSSALDAWKSNNRLRKDKVFSEPLMTEESSPETNIVQSPAHGQTLNWQQLLGPEYCPHRNWQLLLELLESDVSFSMAEYLKEKSVITPISEDLSGELILNKILEGKKRKVCARMFFETLVLKCYGAVDVLQGEPYGDITLKLTHKLFKDHP